MTAPVDLLEVMVLVATVVASASPVILAVLFVRDALRGRLW